MAYSKPKATLATQDSLTLWLKHKFIKKKDGSEKEVFQSSVDIGGGKMIKISIDARLYTIEKPEGILFPAFIQKWKATAVPTSTPKPKNW